MMMPCCLRRPSYSLNPLLLLVLYSTTLLQHVSAKQQKEEDSPNLIILYTDEQNFRTIGAYRSILQSTSQSHLWGPNVHVPTPNIDSLATDGALYTNMYTPIPLCTPSRTAFLTGLYPHATRTGASVNHERLNDGLTTFAHLLSENEYQTAFLGKWHLDGDPKPGWASDYGEEESMDRSFGFQDQVYKFNRGHWKWFEEKRINSTTGITKETKAFPWKRGRRFRDKPEGYATDYIFNKGLKFIKKQIRRKEKFAVMMSISGTYLCRYFMFLCLKYVA